VCSSEANLADFSAVRSSEANFADFFAVSSSGANFADFCSAFPLVFYPVNNILLSFEINLTLAIAVERYVYVQQFWHCSN
jgi:hypothetical protein